MEELFEPKETKKRSGRGKAVLTVRILIAVAGAVWYALYAKRSAAFFELHDWLITAAVLALFAAAMMIAVPKLIDAFSGESDTLLAKPKNSARVFVFIMLGALLLRVVTMLAGTAIYSFMRPDLKGTGLFDLIRAAWMKENIDAQHYLNIAENWYVNTEPDNLLIVFFPMFPILIRVFNSVFHDSFLSAQIINTIAVCLAAGMTYLTLTPIVSDKKARSGAFIALLMPGMIFTNAPMTEPLFILFSACCFYFIQKRELLIAGVFAALAGFTRSLGVLLAVPIAIEGVCYVVRLAKNKKNWKKQLVILIAALLISTLGTLGYLYINRAVTGEWLTFLEYQRLNWYQSFCPFFETVRYISRYLQSAILEGDSSMMWLWITSLVMIFSSLFLVVCRSKRLPATYTFHFFAYFIVAVGCSWLLSAVRYLSAGLPVVAAVALGLDKKWKTAAAFVLLAVCYIGYTWMFMLRWSVY